MIKQFILSLVLLLVSTNLFAVIDLVGNSADWSIVMNGSQFDVAADQQANSSDLELVGGVNLPLLYTQYDDNGTPADTTDDVIAYRVRVSGQQKSDYSNGYLFIGFDLDLDDDLDFYLSVSGKTNGGGIVAWDPGTDLNISPSTTSIDNPTQIEVLDFTALTGNFAYVPVDAMTDPTSVFDSDGSNGADYFINFKLSFIDFKTQAEAKSGITGITSTTAIQYTLATSTNPNSYTSDVGGYDDKNGDLSLSYADPLVSAFSPPLSISNIFPEITSNGGAATAAIAVNEATTAVTTVAAADADGDTVTFSISSDVSVANEDKAKFSIDTNSGNMVFVTAPDASVPTDVGGDNNYQVIVVADDGNGGTDTQAMTVTVNADVTAPATPSVDLLASSDTGVSDADDITSDTTPTIRVTLDQSGAAATIAVAGDVVELFEGATQVGSATLVAGDISNGYVDITSNALSATNLSFTATLTDISNNLSNPSAALAVTLDAVLPVVAITSTATANIVNATAYPVDGTCTVGDGNVTVAIAGAAPASQSVLCNGLGNWSASFDVIAIVDGNNVISVDAKQTDTAGNTGNAITALFDKDVLIATPTVVVLATNNVTPIISGTAEANSIVIVSVAGATFNTFANGGGIWSIDTSSPASGVFNPDLNGANSVLAISTDAAGNSATDVTINELVIDTTKPVIILSGLATVDVELGTSYFEAGATAMDNIDGDISSSVVIAGDTIDVNTLGTYNITYDANDAAGNAAVQVIRPVNVVDTTSPVVSILNQPASVNDLDAFTVTFKFTEVVIDFVSTDITVTNATLSNFVGAGDTYTADIKPMGGDLTITINAGVATDPSGNINTGVSQVTTLDNTPPDVVVTSAPVVNLANQSTYTVSGTCTAGDGDVLVLLSLGSAYFTPFETCTAGGTWDSTFDLSSLSDTAVGFKISVGAQQTDAAGNIGNAVAVEVDKDTVKPNVQIQNVPAFVNSNEFVVTIKFDEAVTGFDSSAVSVTNGAVDIASFNVVDAQTYTVGVVASGAGDVTLNVAASVAQDIVGNDNNMAEPVVAVFDDTPPVVSITNAGVVNAANDDAYNVGGNCDNGDGDVAVTIIGAIPASQNVSCTTGNWSAVFDVSGITDGTSALTINASQTDAAGNTGDAVAVQVDKDVVISIPTVDPLVTNNSTPVITGTADVGTSNEIVVAGATYTVIAAAGDIWTLDTVVAIPDSGSLSLIGGANEVVVTSADSAGNSDVDISNNEITLTLDDDNDGIPNSVECPSGPPFDNSCRDTDGDGIPDFQEVDSDNDGIPDASEAGLDSNNPIDSDGDGTPDYRDTDSDNDGIDDSLEGVIDTDGDGIPDYLDIGSGNDSDGDGIPDNVECPVFPTDCPDTDGDSSPDYLETDSDNDGIDDAIEAGVDPYIPIDTDGDGTPDYRDTDSDADGTDDATEGLVDNDNDGIPDYVDVITTGPGAGDSDGDGIADDIECTLYPLCADSDADGRPDYMETDSDNDGIPDAVETGTAINDADNDGIDDSLDVDITGGLDLDSDGIDDRLPLDTDDDGTPDYRDSDSDNDGIVDVIEGVIDTDADGIPDYLDASNGDASGKDITGSGDSDGDGISDAIECLAGLPCPDVDQDGKPDYMDNNPDDGPGADFDNDGLLNHLDPDDDNDRIPDVVEDPDFDADNNPLTNPLDSDLDSVPDYLDLDSDNDGLSDEVESGATGNDHDNDNIVDHFDIDITGGVDANIDGIDDAAIQLLLDGDSDNLPDYLDVVFDGDRDAADTDKDGIPDSVECPVYPTDCPDSDADGAPDFLETDADGDGIDDRDEAGSRAPGILLDTDGDGAPDYRDTDSDDDGVDDAVEGLSSDADSDGIPDALDPDSTGAAFGGDSDGDGVADMDECTSYPGCTDSDNDGTPDYMDATVNPYDPDATISTGLNGVGSNGPWSLLLIITAFVLRRKAFYKS